MQKKIFTSLILTFIFLSCATNHQKIEKLYLFKAQKAAKTIYLFGTIHYGIEAKDLPKSFLPYFNSADAYAFEKISYSADDKLATKSWILARAKRKKSSLELKKLLTAKEYENLELYFPNLEDKDTYFSNASVFFCKS
ncbi:MAG: TraB/GumN family protein [Bdellovibrionota bacterium]